MVSGSASFDRGQANQLSVTASDRAIINYDSFSIGAGNTVQFIQPSSEAVVLNRVVGADPSNIFGTLSANGHVFLINPNGITFAPGSRVDVAGLVASTLDISNSDFVNGNYVFSKTGKNGYVINQGLISAKSGGYVCLLGQAVENQGTIQVELGSVALAAGNAMTLGFGADGISVAVDEAVKEDVFGPDGKKMDSAVKNSGAILANGSKVLMTAKVLNKVFDYAINNTGLVKVSSLVEHEGVLELVAEGAAVNNSGTLQAGDVHIKVSDSGIVNAANGKIIADAAVILANAGMISLEGRTILQQGLISANSLESADAGDISITGEISTVLDEGSRTQAMAMGLAGNGGRIQVNSSRGSTYVNKGATIDISAGAVSGNGGMAKIDAFGQLGFYGVLNGRAPPGFAPGKAILDPENAEISGTFTVPTTVDATNNITIVGDIFLTDYATLSLYADHIAVSDPYGDEYYPGGEPGYFPEQPYGYTSYSWDDGVGQILNPGDFTISSSGMYGSLTLFAGSGIGSASHPIKTNVGNLTAAINPESSTGDIYITQGTAPLIVSEIISPSSVYLTCGGPVRGYYDFDAVTARELALVANGGIGIAGFDGGDVSVPDEFFRVAVDNLICVNTGSGDVLIHASGESVSILGISNAVGAVKLECPGDLGIRYGIISGGDVDIAAANIFLNIYADIRMPATADLTMTATSGRIAQVNLEEGLLGYWNFDGEAWYYIPDLSGNNNYGSVNGNPGLIPGPVNGAFGDAFDFNGSTDYITVDTNFNLGSGAFTFVTWYKGEQSRSYVGLLGAVPLPAQYDGYTLELHEGYLRSWINGSTYDSSRQINDNLWHQLAWTRTADGLQASLFIDGGVDRDHFSVPGSSVDTAHDFVIGGWGSTRRLIEGALDEVRVYNRELSAMEIKGQYMFAPGTGLVHCGGTAQLSAVAGIDLDFEGLSSLSASNSGTGAILISNKGDFQVAGDGVTNAGGNIDLRAMSTLNINAPVAALNGGSIYLSASDDIVITDTAVSSSIEAEGAAGSGSITLVANRDIVVDGSDMYSQAQSYGPAQSGYVSLTAGDEIRVVDSSIYSQAQSSSYSGANAYAGDVSLTAYGNLSITGYSRVYSQAQSESELSAASSAIAGALLFSAGGTATLSSIATGGDYPVPFFSHWQINSGAAGQGDITIVGDDGVTLNNTLECGNLTITSDYGPVTIDQGAELRQTAPGDILIDAGGSLYLYNSLTGYSIGLSSGDDLFINAPGAGDIISSGPMTIYAYGDVDIQNSLRATGISVESYYGSLSCNALGNQLVASEGDLTLSAWGNIIVRNAMTCGELSIDSLNGFVSIDAPGTEMEVYGDLDITARGDISLYNAFSAANISLISDEGAVTVNEYLTTSGDLLLAAGGNIAVYGSLAGQDVTLETLNGGITFDPGFDGYISASGNVLIDGEDEVEVMGGIEADGTVSINSEEGTVLIDCGAEWSIDAGGYVHITADGNIAINSDIHGTDLVISSATGSLNSGAGYVYFYANRVHIAAVNDFTLYSGEGMALSSDMFDATLLGYETGLPIALTLVAGGPHSITVNGSLNLAEDLILSAGDYLYADGYPISARTIQISSGSDCEIYNDLDSTEYVRLVSGGGLYTGAISAGTFVELESAGSIEVDGDVTAGAYVEMDSGSGSEEEYGIWVGGAISANEYIDLYSPGYLEIDGDITSETGFILLYCDWNMYLNGEYVYAASSLGLTAGGDLETSADLEADSILMTSTGDMSIDGYVTADYSASLYADGTMYIASDITALSIMLHADADRDGTGDLVSAGEMVGLWGSTHDIQAAGDFSVYGEYLYSGESSGFWVSAGDSDWEAGSFTLDSTAGSVTIDGVLERGDTGVIRISAAGDIDFYGSIFTSAPLYLTSRQGAINGGVSYGYGEGEGYEGSYGPNISSASSVWLTGQTIGSFENPLDVETAGDCVLYAYGQNEGTSACLTGSVNEQTVPEALTVNYAAGKVYFNGVERDAPAPEPYVPPVEPQVELPVMDDPLTETGEILSGQPTGLTGADLSKYQFSSPLGTVYFYHPLVSAELAAAAPLVADASSYELVGGELRLVGHEGLLEFFQQLDRQMEENGSK